MITMGIETSCDETACGIVENGYVLADVVSSSVDLHKKYGGVVPEIASRCHIEYINDVVKGALKKAKKTLKQIDVFAVTEGPGLCGSLLTGIAYAKSLSFALTKPLVGINHLLAHLSANFIDRKSPQRPRFPYVGLIISGGHTNIYLCKGITDYKILGRTQDDAVGEAFDKVAKILKLGYPGGPVIEKMAGLFTGKDPVKFPRAYLGKDSLDFSFSGIKTAVLYYVGKKRLTKNVVSSVAYGFQEAVFDVIVDKVVLASRKSDIKTVVVGGGVAANKRLTEKMGNICGKNGIKIFIPSIRYCMDNGSMVAAFGEMLFRKGIVSSLDLNAQPNMEDLV